MKETKAYNIDEKTLEKIISAAYGSADIFEKLEVFFLIRKNPEAKKLFNEYKKTADEVHSLKRDELPESVLNGVKEKINGELKIEEKKTFLTDLTALIFLKPRASFAAVVLLAIAITLSVFVHTENPEPHYSQVEIEAASLQTKQALVLVSGILLSAEKTLTKEVIPNKVVKPVNESFNYVNNFMRGEKNEKPN